MTYDVSCMIAAEAPAFARAMAEALATGREFAVWIAGDAGDERLAYTVRHEAGAYRVRDADLSDVGSFASVGAAMRQGTALVDGVL